MERCEDTIFVGTAKIEIVMEIEKLQTKENNMQKDFVTFELAKKLNEKWFRELCLTYYTNDDTLYYNYSHKAGACYKDCYLSHNSMPKNSVSGKFVDAPTISQVLKWLRKVKNIFVEPCVLADADTDADGKVINEYTYWSFIVTNIETGDMIYFEYERIDDKRFDSYEQAAIAGIEYVIDNFI